MEPLDHETPETPQVSKEQNKPPRMFQYNPGYSEKSPDPSGDIFRNREYRHTFGDTYTEEPRKNFLETLIGTPPSDNTTKEPSAAQETPKKETDIRTGNQVV